MVVEKVRLVFVGDVNAEWIEHNAVFWTEGPRLPSPFVTHYNCR